jgi:hypothetical protein
MCEPVWLSQYSDWLRAGWLGYRGLIPARIVPLASCIQTDSGPNQPPGQRVLGGPFPRAKAQPGHDADLSPPFSAEVENEYELYLLTTQAPSWHVMEQFF